MAKPRVFVSATYYDLKHLRSAIEAFIDSLGYEPILSEKGSIAYSPDLPLDESCYREVKNTDIFVLVIGGRYGSEKSGGRGGALPQSFFERYDSVTKMEYSAAVQHDIPIYIFVERGVYAEYQTFLRNKDKHDVTYAHVDSVNVFLLLEEILAQPRNNPVKEFDRYEDIETWLREQWSGLFKDMLQRTSNQKQLASLQQQVANLAAIGDTLQRYLEAVVEKVSPQRAPVLIEEEQQKLERARQHSKVRQNDFVRYLDLHHKIPPEVSAETISEARDFESLGERLSAQAETRREELQELICTNVHAQKDINDARRILGIKVLTAHPRDPKALKQRKQRRRQPRTSRTRPAA